MNTNRIDESVSVDLLSSHLKRKAIPWVMEWRGRRYRIRKVGLHYWKRRGAVLYHVFCVTDEVSTFELEFNTETLEWKLLQIESS